MTQACSNMWSTLKQVQVWQPTIYMYLSWALTPDISEGKFYWYNDSSVGPGFSEVLLCFFLSFSESSTDRHIFELSDKASTSEAFVHVKYPESST